MSKPWVSLTDIYPGYKMCCVCMEFIPFDELYVDSDGQKWDHCIPCNSRVWKDPDGA